MTQWIEIHEESKNKITTKFEAKDRIYDGAFKKNFNQKNNAPFKKKKRPTQRDQN